MQDKLSVIVPVYNAEKFLPECLDSLVNQTHQNLEIICVNDGSIDNSLSILREYARKDSRIVILDQANSGAVATRANGLALASADYVAFMDSDDYLDVNCYQKAMAALQNSGADAAVFDYEENGTPQGNWEDAVLEGQQIFQAYLNGSIHNKLWNKVWKRALTKHVVVPYGRSIKEDASITAQMLRECDKVVMLKEVLHHYRVIPSSLSRKKEISAVELAGMYRNELDKLQIMWEKLPENRVEIGKKFVCELSAIMMAKVDTEHFSLWDLYCGICSENENLLLQCCSNAVERGIILCAARKTSYKESRLMVLLGSLLWLKPKMVYAVLRNW